MKDIPEYESLYAATEDGQIWSYRTQKYLKPSEDRRGYLYVTLRKDKKQKTCRVHRLIALTYIPNPNNLSEIDHIDRNKLNNSIENLRWVTRSENNLNRDMKQFREKLRETYRNIPEEVKKERAQKAAQVNSKVVEMRDKNNHDIIIKTYPNGKEAAIQEFGDARKQSNISACAHGKRPSAYGYFWTFADVDVTPE